MTGRQRCDLILHTIDEVLDGLEPEAPAEQVPAPPPVPAEATPGADALVRWGVVPRPLVPRRA